MTRDRASPALSDPSPLITAPFYQSHTDNTCFHCGLPVSASLKDEGETDGEIYCCSGCYFVSKITRNTGDEGNKKVLAGRFIIGFILSMNVFLLSFPFYGGYIGDASIPKEFANPLRFLLLSLSLPVLFILGYPIAVTAKEMIKKRHLGIEPLILLGSLSAFLVSVKSTYQESGNLYFETVTMLLTLYTLGRYIEAQARSKATGYLRGMASLMPNTINSINAAGETKSVSADMITKGQTILVKPGERIPVDGQIKKGKGAIDESFFTGESKPLFKKENDLVISGTLNLDGSIIVEVMKEPCDFLVTKIERLMEEVRREAPAIKKMGDAIATLFIPVVSILALGIFLFCAFQGNTEEGTLRMLSVLLISCPCAFGLSAPMAIWKGFSRAAERGAIIKSPHVLEQLGKTVTVFFDKTGTITDQTLVVEEIYCSNSMDADTVLSIASALETHSTHPIAHSILLEAEGRGLEKKSATEVQVSPGFGVEGTINERKYCIGGQKWIQERGISFSNAMPEIIEQKIKQGNVPVLLGSDKKVQGIIFCKQIVRENVEHALTQLQHMGINRILLTGDSAESIEKLQVSSLFNHVHSKLSPLDKVIEVQKETQHHQVLMVGDGLNDAPALEAASIGIAMGCGSDLTRESAQISLLGNNLLIIPELIQLSRAVRKRIITNYCWAFGYNIIGIYLAITGTLSPLFAVSAMVFSSLFVIANSLRSYEE